MAYPCPFCGERLTWREEDDYTCGTHGRFRMEKLEISGFKWLEAEK